MDRLPDRACLWLAVTYPEIASTRRFTHAATIEAPDTFHDRSPPGSFKDWRQHPVRAGDVVITFPRLRRVVVSVIGDDTHRPVAGARVVTIDDDPQGELTSSAVTDRDGNAVLGLPQPAGTPGSTPSRRSRRITSAPSRARWSSAAAAIGLARWPCRPAATSDSA
jgi:hypothetical protein